MADISKVADICAMASSKPPREWTRDVLQPIGPRWLTIFAHGLIEISANARLELVAALIWTDLAQSRGEAKAAIKAGAVRINSEVCKDAARVIGVGDVLPNLGAIVLENGRRNYGVIVVEGT